MSGMFSWLGLQSQSGAWLPYNRLLPSTWYVSLRDVLRFSNCKCNATLKFQIVANWLCALRVRTVSWYVMPSSGRLSVAEWLQLPEIDVAQDEISCRTYSEDESEFKGSELSC